MRWNGRERGAAWEAEWNTLLASYENAHPELAAEFTRRLARRLPDGWAAFRQGLLATHLAQAKPNATRKDSKAVLEAVLAQMPELLRRFGRSLGVQRHRLQRHQTPARHRHERQLRTVRGARIRHGGDGQRHLPARGLPPVRRYLPGLLRLRPERRAPVGRDASAGRLCLHPRLDRRRRGRPHPPARRASGEPAPDAQSGGLAAGRRAGNRRRLAARDRTPRRPRGARPDPPEPAPDRCRPGAPRWCSARRLCGARTRRPGGPRDHCHRLGSGAGDHGGEIARNEGVMARVVSMPCAERFTAQDAAWKGRGAATRADPPAGGRGLA